MGRPAGGGNYGKAGIPNVGAVREPPLQGCRHQRKHVWRRHSRHDWFFL